MYLFLPNFQQDLECFLDFLYIPQCIYFYESSLKVCIISGGSLYSTMYLFLRVCGTFYFTGGFTLHSTMYLFLRASQQEQIRYLSTFTFHNVSISTRDCLSRMVFRLSTLHSTMYLFLRGIVCQGWYSAYQLYIPQCIYFYSDNLNAFRLVNIFTFHNVSISTHIKSWSVLHRLSLHSTMYLFLL